jgi:uncharacterized protein DUF4440
MRARTIALLLAALLLAGCGSPKPNTWSGATGAEQFERLFWQSVQKKEWNDVEHHLAASFVMSTPAGRLDREAALANLQQLDVQEFSLGDVDVRPAGSDMIVTYTVTLRGTAGGRPLPSEPVHMMSVWQQVKHGWIMIAHAVSSPAKM